MANDTRNNPVAVREAKQDLVANIERMKPQIEASLPPGVPADRFMRVVMNAVQNDPGLLDPQVDRASVYSACLRAAQDGLMPDKKEGAIVIYSEKRGDSWIKKAQFLPMIGGLRKLAAEHGFDLVTRVVHEHDHFEYVLGDDEKLVHVPPKLGQDRGKIIGAYAVATRLADGRKYRDVMDRARIDRAKAVAKTSGVWDKWYDEQACKTVGKHLFKQLPLADVSEQARRVMDEADDLDTATDVTPPAAQQQAPAPQQQPAAKRPRGLARVIEHEAPQPQQGAPAVDEWSRQAFGDTTAIDAETGEVLDTTKHDSPI